MNDDRPLANASEGQRPPVLFRAMERGVSNPWRRGIAGFQDDFEPEALTLEEHALIAATLAVRTNEPRAEVLLPFKLSEAAWEEASATFMQRIVDEIRTHAGSGVPIEQRYPLSAAYAKAYSDALREVRNQRARGDEEATLRIPAGAPLDEPLSLLGASNRAATISKRTG